MPKKPRLIGAAMFHVPEGDFPSFGYGLAAVNTHEWVPRIAAARHVLGIIDGEIQPSASPETLEALSTVKGLFSRIALGDRYDWFSVSRQLGYPSARFSRKVSNTLAFLRFGLQNGHDDVVSKELAALREEPVADCLDVFLKMTERAARPLHEEGWAYILWSGSERDLLHIGAAAGTIDDVLRRLRTDYPDHHPFGVLAAWLVHDPLEAHHLIRKLFDGELVGDGFYRTRLGDAKNRIGRALERQELLAHSPWHGDGPESGEDEPVSGLS